VVVLDSYKNNLFGLVALGRELCQSLPSILPEDEQSIKNDLVSKPSRKPSTLEVEPEWVTILVQ
jgi:hypothetical protein